MALGPAPVGSAPRPLPFWGKVTRLALRQVARMTTLTALGCALGGFLLGRAVPDTHIAPFGVAFAVAVRAGGLGGLESLPTLLAVMAGAASVQPAHGAWQAVGLAALAGQLVVSPVARGRRSESLGVAPVVAGLSTVLGTLGLALYSHGLRGDQSWMLIFWCGLAGALCMLFSFAVADFRLGRALSEREPGAFILFMAAVACALVGLDRPDRLPIARGAVASLMVLLSATAAGAPLGATAGAIFGLGNLLASLTQNPLSLPVPASLPQATGMAYVLAGMLGGAFRDLGRLGAAVAYLVGLALASLLLTGDVKGVGGTLFGAVAGAALYLALPHRWVLPGAGRDSAAEEARGRMLSRSLLDRVRTMSRALREVSHTFEQVATVGVPAREAEEAYGEVARRVCQSCSMLRHCWDQERAATETLFADLWNHVEESGPLPMHPLPDNLHRHCIYPDRVALALNDAHDQQGDQRRWARQLGENRLLARDYVSNVARLLDEMAETLESPDPQAHHPHPPLLRVVMGCAALPKRGGHISGDSILSAPLGIDRHLLALSDGMGVGTAAAWESRQCVTLLQTLLEAGFATEVAIETVNSVLLLHTADEKFATLDIAIIDLTTGRTEFVKVGAAPSFIKRGQDVTVVKVPSMPVGIVSQVTVEPEFRLVRPGDMVVMLTDGIWDVARDESDKERWLLDLLEREATPDPDALARRIMAGALDHMPDVADDMTVVVARLESIPEARSGQAPLHGWATVADPPRFGRRHGGGKSRPPKEDEP